MAGGLTPYASKSVSITHRAPPWDTVTVNLAGTRGDELQNDVEVQPGDRIVVLRAGVVYVIGDVGKPGGYFIEGKQTVHCAAGPGTGARHESHGQVEWKLDTKYAERAHGDAVGIEQDSRQSGSGRQAAGWRHRLCAS